MSKMKPDKTIYSQTQEADLPEGITLENGFLKKKNSIIGVVTSGIIQTANEGFLHVEETEKYETK